MKQRVTQDVRPDDTALCQYEGWSPDCARNGDDVLEIKRV